MNKAIESARQKIKEETAIVEILEALEKEGLPEPRFVSSRTILSYEVGSLEQTIDLAEKFLPFKIDGVIEKSVAMFPSFHIIKERADSDILEDCASFTLETSYFEHSGPSTDLRFFCNVGGQALTVWISIVPSPVQITTHHKYAGKTSRSHCISRLFCYNGLETGFTYNYKSVGDFPHFLEWFRAIDTREDLEDILVSNK